jgi:hypothetical protein
MKFLRLFDLEYLFLSIRFIHFPVSFNLFIYNLKHLNYVHLIAAESPSHVDFGKRFGSAVHTSAICTSKLHQDPPVGMFWGDHPYLNIYMLDKG